MEPNHFGEFFETWVKLGKWEWLISALPNNVYPPNMLLSYAKTMKTILQYHYHHHQISWLYLSHLKRSLEKINWRVRRGHISERKTWYSAFYPNYLILVLMLQNVVSIKSPTLRFSNQVRGHKMCTVKVRWIDLVILESKNRLHWSFLVDYAHHERQTMYLTDYMKNSITNQ